MMDSLGEVGKKMRSAIKAKLVELGNASATGYIDDELPDYVMIMVANKRSKQQMLTDLNLFLGSNTETFVTWLHQVLQKLQEVTLPTNLATKAKKKISESSSGGKKDKKKDKKKPKEPSITDVIAVELMEKAKKTIDPKVKDEKSRTPSPPPAPQINSPEKSSSSSSATNNSSSHRNSNKDDDLGFPTISEIQKTQGTNVLHRKELAQLEATNNKIGETKRKLISMTISERREKTHDEEMRVSLSPEPITQHYNKSHSQQPPQQQQQQQQKPGSVKSRLGARPIESSNNNKSANIISLSAIRKSETEFLKKIVVKQKEDNERKVDDYRSSRNRTDSNSRSRRDNRRSRSTSRDRHRNNRDRGIRNRRTRSRSPIKSSVSYQDNKSNRPSIRQRIGERIMTSSHDTNKKHSKTPETDGNFKVKTRPNSTITAHAGKSLLLRAMADAQKSTLASTESKKKQQRDNIVVKLKNSSKNNAHQNDEEYVPESISGHSESEAEYHPSYKSQNQENAAAEDDGDVISLNNNDDDVDLDDLDEEVNELKEPNIVIMVKNDESNKKEKEKSKSPTPPPVIKRHKKDRLPIKDRIGSRSSEVKPKDEYRQRKRPVEESMETDECETQHSFSKVKNPRVSPIKFDLTDDENDDKSRSSSRDRSDKKSSKNDSEHNGDEHKDKKIRLEASRSFDHVPSSLNSVAVPVPDTLKPIIKSTERCKFFPDCQKSKCNFFHPSLTPCKLFPNCKYGADSCGYTHPKCKFDLSCHRIDCNFAHTPITPSSTPAIASSVVPAQNYKSITLTPNMIVCKFFPGCANTNCIYQHPKICKFGKTCANKYECNFYHFELSSKNKFKWVSSST